MIAVVLSGQNASPIGGHAATADANSVSVAPSVTMSNTSGSSVLLHFHYIDNIDAGGFPDAPTGYTRRVTTGAAFGNGVCLNTNDATTSDGAVSQTNGGTFTSYAAATVEILD
jgi:hypothetical protein